MKSPVKCADELSFSGSGNYARDENWHPKDQIHLADICVAHSLFLGIELAVNLKTLRNFMQKWDFHIILKKIRSGITGPDLLPSSSFHAPHSSFIMCLSPRDI